MKNTRVILILGLVLVLGRAATTMAFESHTRIFSRAWPAHVQIDSGGTTQMTGEVEAPLTVRNWIFDMDFAVNDWPHGPRLIDAATMSSITRLSGSTTPRSYYGLELVVFRTRDAYSLPGVGGADAIRGAEITMWDSHMPWETPHDADRWKGLGIYAEIDGEGVGRQLGIGLDIGGRAGWQRYVNVSGPDGRTLFRVDDAGVWLRTPANTLRRLVVAGDGTVRAIGQ